MASRFIEVNTAALVRDRDEIVGQLKFIEGKMADMKQAVAELDRMWTGAASQAFRQVFEDDMAFLLEVCQGIQKAIEYETNAVSEYNICENKVREQVQGIEV